MAVLLPQGRQQFFDAAGAPLVGGKVYTYEAGTSTPKATYTDAAGTVPNTNPVILNSRGEATIFWDGAYKVVLRDASDVTIWTQDNVTTDDNAAPADALRADLADPATGKGVALVRGAPRVVSSIASLRALPKTGAAYALVLGYYTSGDEGGGLYWYDAADTTSADNGGTVIVASDDARWKRSDTGDIIKARAFGAKAGVDCTTAIQAAIDACPAGGVVALPPSDCTITGRLTINKSITLQGDTQYQTAIIAVGCSALLIDRASNVQLRNLEIAASVRHTTTPNAYVGIEVTGSTGTRPSNHIYRDVLIDGFSVGYKSAWLWSSAFDNFRTNACAIGMQAKNLSVNNVVHGCSFIGAAGLAGSRGIQLDGNVDPSEGWMISDTLFDDFEIGIEGIAVTHVLIDNCIIDHNRANGVLIGSAGVNFGGNWTVRGCYIAMQGAGGDAAIGSTNAAASSQNRGNVIAENQILVYAGSACLRGIYMSGSQAVRNVIQGNTVKGFSTFDIHANTGPDVIIGNICQSAIALNIAAVGQSVLANNIGTIAFNEFQQYMPIGQNKMTWSYAIPTTGTWTQGDICWKSNVAAGGSPGWICTASGTPGTWKAMAAVGA